MHVIAVSKKRKYPFFILCILKKKHVSTYLHPPPPILAETKNTCWALFNVVRTCLVFIRSLFESHPTSFRRFFSFEIIIFILCIDIFRFFPKITLVFFGFKLLVIIFHHLPLENRGFCIFFQR